MMHKKTAILTIILLSLVGQICYSQNLRSRDFRQAYSAPEEIVSLSGSMSFSQALLIFNELSKKYLGKVIVDPEDHSFPIGEDINKMHWLDAFELILKLHDLWYEEYADYIKIVPVENEQTKKDTKAEIDFGSREVVISAIFFETNNSKLRQAGMSWDFFRGKDINLSATLSSADSKSGIYEMQVSPDLDFGNLLAIFKTLENDQIGEVIASPQITVKSEQQGRIQVGSDIAVTIRDFAGNSVTKFFSTGSIIKVTPTVVNYDSIDFVKLDLEIERSNTSTGDVGLEIKKTAAQTSVLLLDGEETIIGGLYINEETRNRDGIPLLKDLPWWFFGLRYVFGFDSKSDIKKELLILIKAELLPSLRERFRNKLDWRHRQDLVKQQRKKIKQEMEMLKKQWDKGK